MRCNKNITVALVLVLGVLLMISATSAVYMRALPQYAAPGVYTTGPTGILNYDESICREVGQDFIIQIAPFGCENVPVRSDLLEEQDVIVFCQLAATNINPLIDVEAIDAIYFSEQQRPKEVKHIGFFPARAALRVQNKLNSPILNNIGYLTVVLSRQPNESAMPEFVEGNLTARIRYDIKNAWGIGKANYYLPVLGDQEFEDRFNQYSFWEGRGYLRAEAVDQNSAVISIYSSTTRPVREGPGQVVSYARGRVATVNLKKGETSNKIYLPGIGFCLASLQVRLNDIEAPDTRAKIKVNSDVLEVARGERFLENRCVVRDIQRRGVVEKVRLNCREDTGSRNFEFTISPKVKLTVNGEEREVRVGDKLYTSSDNGKIVYVGYIGSKGNSYNEKELYVRFVSLQQERDSLNEEELDSVAKFDGYFTSSNLGIGLFDKSADLFKFGFGQARRSFYWLIQGWSFYTITYEDKEKDVFGKLVKLIGFAEPTDLKIF